ncbi:MAG TPA: polysaccharide pyruvyl transferase family protein [Hydrogenothermaceae bacterium]|nr:polysaccharide pyruvyl transferase family protein [Hydrogenothermaceae bacterium]
MRKNILFSTTRQWNPGDEFILLGTINILKEVLGEFNPIIYNRNPETRQTFQYLNPFRKIYINNNKILEIVNSFLRIGFWDNSFKDTSDISNIDLVVFAGSPEWIGGRLDTLYKQILKNNILTIYIGIGSGNTFKYKNLKKLYKTALEKSILITTRDTYTYNELKTLNPYLLPCPALFSSKEEKKISKVKKIGLIYATYKSAPYNKISKNAYNYLKKVYTKLLKHFDCEIICHYIDELDEVYKDFPGVKIYYSYDSKDYINIYKNFDIVIGPRIHGIGISASIGIPGILIGHDIRADTGKGFLADIFNYGEDYKSIIQNINLYINNIRKINKNLRQYKYKVKEIYISLLKSKLTYND